jgi:hypothetical protein
MEVLATLLRGATIDVPLVALRSLFGAHFAHCAGEALSCALGSNWIVHEFLPLFVPLLFGECGPFTILAD